MGYGRERQYLLLHRRHGFRLWVRCMLVLQGRRLGLPRKEAFVHHCVLHREPERVVLHHWVRLRRREGEARWKHLHHGGLLRIHHKGTSGEMPSQGAYCCINCSIAAISMPGNAGACGPSGRSAWTSIGEVRRCPRCVLACRVLCLSGGEYALLVGLTGSTGYRVVWVKDFLYDLTKCLVSHRY